MKRKFIETHAFQELLSGEKELWLEKRIKDEILEEPLRGDLIKGSGGFRKIRISKNNTGKSGGYRVIYLDIESFETTYLFLIYGKNVKDNLTDDETNWLKKQSEIIKNEYKKTNKKSHI
ncbi:MAG: type II toxin-antitoxin system RelE/ParE family toxin [Oligoflexia bacterium]|nr:type II toxin-antitoxin system RelE/ParE family toxin [Oligoflexia bacterium]